MPAVTVRRGKRARAPAGQACAWAPAAMAGTTTLTSMLKGIREQTSVCIVDAAGRRAEEVGKPGALARAAPELSAAVAGRVELVLTMTELPWLRPVRVAEYV